MYAILAHRHAGGDSVDGQAFEHQRWTLVEALSPALEAAAVPEPGQIQPRLRVVAVDDADDPRLAGRAVVGHEPVLPGVETTSVETEEDIDLDQATLPVLKKLAKLLGISRSQGRADLITAIREKHAALDAAEAEPSEVAAGDQAETEEDKAE